jgi:Cu2+-exporting ATPase
MTAHTEMHHHEPDGMSATGHSGHQGHDKHEGHSPEMFRDRLWVSLALTVPILYFSTQIQEWFGYDAVTFSGDGWVSPILATVLFLYAGAVFLKGGYRELRDRVPGMMVLISLAITVAYGYSLAVSLGLDGKLPAGRSSISPRWCPRLLTGWGREGKPTTFR